MEERDFIWYNNLRKNQNPAPSLFQKKEETKMEENQKHHFLYYLFKADKATKKIPEAKLEKMLKIIKKYPQKAEEKEI